ncbi:DnaB-like helicase N-terminal domain-containing protein [Paraburkholderia phymatum]|uniref:DnaB domain protein helicase domain protein n=1 Tax=Paraburkholderia phymatum (strain DSM 17167 / CIP 108236 / LMG 21445 / STM815) TaxID=391038 RepID=B2JL35_PARP8|nr:DnaB-like helicase N-terminal domain-containing protein [Paraburkholderia phymatum]ACC72564.1 DnaB domain protein helicase domain protein [Paraburkholderia phymatum STM815]
MNFENDLRTRAERLVLSALMQDNGSLRHIATLRPSHFSHDTHGQIFRHMLALIAKDVPADACSVFASMGHKRQLRKVGLFSYLCEIAALPAIPANIGFYACALTSEELVSMALRLAPVLLDPAHDHRISDPGHCHDINRPLVMWAAVEPSTDR